jgi:hypothetical protein
MSEPRRVAPRSLTRFAKRDDDVSPTSEHRYSAANLHFAVVPCTVR